MFGRLATKLKVIYHLSDLANRTNLYTDIWFPYEDRRLKGSYGRHFHNFTIVASVSRINSRTILASCSVVYVKMEMESNFETDKELSNEQRFDRYG